MSGKKNNLLKNCQLTAFQNYFRSSNLERQRQIIPQFESRRGGKTCICLLYSILIPSNDTRRGVPMDICKG